MILLVYGFAKINGSQFTILDSELDKPMGQVSGFWLTWNYFGYSTVYGTFLALSQIVGALLLTFQRTALLGACVLAPILVNIILIDACYGVGPDVTLIATLLLVGTLSIIWPRREELLAILWPATDDTSGSAWRSWLKWCVRAAMVSLAFGFTYWVANFNNRAPTPIDGAWDVVQVEPSVAEGQLPATIFFEYNRASMAVFKSKDGVYKTHHFDVDRANSRVEISEKWEGKGTQIFDGTYTTSGTELKMTGVFRELGNLTLDLRKRSVRQ
ncbi:MAG: hypothetical protein ABI824_14170 [Acidobacteriota bacterium]